MIGKRFSRLIVNSLSYVNYHWEKYYHCVCDCGVETTISGSHLRSGRTKSCGCLRRERLIEAAYKHGQSGKNATRSHRTWSGMLQRCYNQNEQSYKNYGGRGIKVATEWHDFINFYRDMGDRPDGKTLDRRDNNGDYCKSNCRWASWDEQANNKRNSAWLVLAGIRMTTSDWARFLDLNEPTVRSRIHRGQSVADAFGVKVFGGAIQ